MNKGGEMRPKLKIVIRPFWKKDTISFIDYELSSPDIKVSPGVPMLCRFDEGFGGLCPFPDMEYLRIEDEKGFLECEEKEMWTSP